jgi:hypothetical protein
MPKIIAAITMSVDGYITGPDDRPESLDLENRRVHLSRWATFIEFAVRR